MNDKLFIVCPGICTTLIALLNFQKNFKICKKILQMAIRGKSNMTCFGHVKPSFKYFKNIKNNFKIGNLKLLSIIPVYFSCLFITCS